MSYNGWSNYETWNVALWMDNEPGTYEMAREWATEAIENAEACEYLTKQEVATRDVASSLEDFIRENNPLADDASVYSDILSANLSEVNWHAIAEGWVQETVEVTP